MTTFLLLGLVMALGAVACVVVPLLRGYRAHDDAGAASNVAILRDQLAELEHDLARGTLSRTHYDEARTELERRVLDESQIGAGTRSASVRSSPWAAVVIATAIPVAAGMMYLAIGSPGVISGDTKVAAGAEQPAVSPQQIDAMLAKVRARLEQEPNDANGWVLLARTYYATGRFAEAVPAYERATALVPDSAELLADYADALGASTQSLAGKPMQIVAQALQIDGKQWKALALAGTYAFDQKDYAQAIVYWERLKAVAPPESEMARSADESLAQARALGGATVGATGTSPTAMAGKPAAPAVGATSVSPTVAAATPAKEPVAIAGTVTLAPALAAKAAPTDTIFIFARAAQGPKMPLAILRKQVKDLPVRFTLDESMAMAPGMSLANFADVIVGARISKSGQAIAQSGDLEGLSQPVKTGTKDVAIVIGDVVK